MSKILLTTVSSVTIQDLGGVVFTHPISNFVLYDSALSENEFELPIITCNETSTQMPVVYFKSANYTRISEENGCILVEGANSYDFLRLKDRFLYAVYNVI